jgi:predicted esterase
MNNSSGLSLLVALVFGPLGAVLGQERDFAPNQKIETFKERSPHSPLAEQAKRLGWSKEVLARDGADYELSEETFRVYVPKKRRGRRYGLLVWIAPGPLGIIPPWWEKSLRKRGLIAVGANKGGNPRAETVRLGLALDSVHALTQRYEIDPKRIYVAGFSGGSNMSCLLTFHYPEIFRGGIYLAGALYVRDVPIPDHPTGRRWIGGIPPPTPERLTLVKERTKHVYLSGVDDIPNLAQTRAVQALAESDGFLHTTFIDVPKLGHGIPKPKVFEKCLRLVEKKLKTPKAPKAP